MSYIIKPVGTVSINNNNTFTKSNEVLLNLFAADNVGVVGYYVSCEATVPIVTDSKWVLVVKAKTYIANIPYTFDKKDGIKTIYVWYKDNIGNISDMASASIILDTLVPITSVGGTSANTYVTTANGNDEWNISNVNITVGNNKVIVVPVDDSKLDKVMMTVVYTPVVK